MPCFRHGRLHVGFVSVAVLAFVYSCWGTLRAPPLSKDVSLVSAKPRLLKGSSRSRVVEESHGNDEGSSHRDADEASEPHEHHTEDAAVVEERGDGEKKEEGEHHADAEGHGEEAGGEEPEEHATASDTCLALMLMGGVCFVMFLFIAANLSDPDMRYYVWSVISSTIAIFVSVLIFTALNSIIHQRFLKESPKALHILVGGAQVVIYAAAMQVAAASFSGGLSLHRPDALILEAKESRELGAKESRELGPSNEDAVKILQDSRRTNVICWCTLTAHMTGFAAMQFGEMMQSGLRHLSENRLIILAPCLIMSFLLWLMNVAFRILRSQIMKLLAGEVKVGQTTSRKSYRKTNYDSQKEFVLALWEEEVYEAEKEASGLCISFLIVQALRYNLTGIMPDALGGEPVGYRHDFMLVADIFDFTLVFIVLTGLMVIVVTKAYSRKHIEDLSYLQEEFDWRIFFKMLLKRLALVTLQVVANCTAWCFLFGCQWEFVRLFPQTGSPMHIQFRILLAVCISMLAFFITLLLDKIADSKLVDDDDLDEMMDLATKKIIIALSISVGFSWEQAFDTGVEISVEILPAPSFLRKQPELMQCIGVFPLAVLVIFAWSNYILQKVLALEESREVRKEASKQPSRKIPSREKDWESCRETEIILDNREATADSTCALWSGR